MGMGLWRRRGAVIVKSQGLHCQNVTLLTLIRVIRLTA
jgi:hypothetical protein